MLKQWLTQQSNNLEGWLHRKRLLAMQQRIQRHKALLSGHAQPSAYEMHQLGDEILRDIKLHSQRTSMRTSTRTSTITQEKCETL